MKLVLWVQIWGIAKWSKVKLEAFWSGLILIRSRKWRGFGLLLGIGRQPGGFANNEKVKLTQFGTQNIFHISHFLSGYVAEHQVECSSLERTDVYLIRGCPYPAQLVPNQAYWLTFLKIISRNHIIYKRRRWWNVLK